MESANSLEKLSAAYTDLCLMLNLDLESESILILILERFKNATKKFDTANDFAFEIIDSYIEEIRRVFVIDEIQDVKSPLCVMWDVLRSFALKGKDFDFTSL